MRNTVICLIGHYGVGKLTIARQICAQTHALLFDNHLANNVIFSLIAADGKSKLPQPVWDLIRTIREQAFTAIETLADPHLSYVLTNVIFDNPRDRQGYERIALMAERRSALFVPVILTCSEEAFAARVPTADRAARLKHIDPVSAADVRREQVLLPIDHPARFDLDTTAIPPDEAARRIVAHARSFVL